MDDERLCAEMRRLARGAAAIVMEVYARADFDVRAKSDESPVTEADEAADRLIREGLRAAFPEVPVVTEEDAASHAIRAPDRFFIVDPLDGTKEFVRRGGDFTVNIALVEYGAPIHGVVLAPASGRLFATAPGGGAVEATGGRDRPIAVAEVSGPLRVVASRSHRDRATDDYIALYDVGDFVAAGSSLKFCLLAAGEADLYPRLGRTMEWDTAAGHAVLRAAGGRVDRLSGDGPLVYGKPGWENPFFVAYAPGVDVLPCDAA